MTLYGPECCRFYRERRAEKLLLCCDAVDLEFGLSNRTEEMVAVKRAMMDSVDQVILVCDHTKFNKRSISRICGVERIQKIVTDAMDDAFRKELEDRRVEVVTD